MKRIAFFGPLNPTPSGISDYDEELLPLLSRYYRIDVFVDSRPQPPRIFSHLDFYPRHQQQPYDLILYQMGNALVHEYIYGYVFQFPGAVVFHDYCLHHSRAKMLLLKGLFEEYQKEALMAHPEEPRLGKSLCGGMAGDLLLYYYPFVRLLLESALAAAAHTDFVVQKLRITETPVVKIPMGVRLENASAEELYPGKVVMASFGLATPEKRITTVLEALAELRSFYPHLLYLIAGEVSPQLRLREWINWWKLQEYVVITGRVDRLTFHKLLSRADIVINLRYPTAREMSATLLRAMGYGKPVLISRLLHLAEIPDDAAIRIRPDRELEDLFHHLWQLIEYPSLREKWGQRAREYFQAKHSMEKMVDAYREFIELALERKHQFRPPVLPLHLRSGKEIMREYVKKTCFAGADSPLLDLIL